ncbi:MAG TPA: OmpA family protein [Phnomibacter sp.]|nr:OmpA family protein [Phnomibacter sp.]
MQAEQQTSHTNPGFGTNTGGWGIFIVALVAILLALIAWNFWNHGHKEYEHYRLTRTEGPDEHGGSHSTDGHGGEQPKAPKAAPMAAAVVNPAELGELDVNGNFIYKVGDTVALKLPDGSFLKVGERSTENRLLKFLANKAMLVDTADKTKGWITCDRIFFETGKAGLTIESQQQITNIANILKAFPAAEVKIGGYTDNTGDSAVNQRVSQQRADMVLQALKAAGASNATAAEGYGPLWPLASNETPEGRAINRRVDIRVTKK